MSVRWLRANAAAYGADPDHLGIWGGSAGAHLAALVGVTGDLPELEGTSGSPGYSSRVQAVALASGPSDFLHAGGGEMDTEADGPVTWLFGGTKKERADLMRLGSPLSHITSDAPPFLIAHGTLDETVPFQQAEFLYAALTAVNVEVELIPLDGFYHNWTTQVENIPEREDTWKLGPMALPFFQKHLRP